MCNYFLGTFGQGKPWCIKHTEVKKESSNNNCICKEQVSSAVFESRQEPEEQAQENNSPEVISSAKSPNGTTCQPVTCKWPNLPLGMYFGFLFPQVQGESCRVEICSPEQVLHRFDREKP